jgi:hypothetical protein
LGVKVVGEAWCYQIGRAMLLRRKVGEKEVKSNFAHVLSVITAEVVICL